MTICDCPGEGLLRTYLAGGLDRATHEALDDHLDACAACQTAADELESTVDSSFPGLKPVALTMQPDDAPLHQLVARVKTFAAGLPTTNGDAAPGEGAVLGNYILLEPLGGGGMGRLFKARHRLMKRVVALKILSPELLRSADARARFRREVEAAARLTHPNVVAAYDAGEADGRDFLVMEYVEGQNLADVVKRAGPLPAAQALSCVAQAARGLACAHAAGLVHRDVKPANLLLDAAGVVKVLDMGLARLAPADDAPPGLTATGVVMGTAAYMAPEQAADTRRADARSDVYGLGCCLYFLLTGRPPYDGRTPMETVFAHREQPIPGIREVRPDCPAALDALFRRMIAKRPEDRPASMAVALAELEAPQRRAPAGRRHKTPRLVAAGMTAVAASLALLALVRLTGRPVTPTAAGLAAHVEPAPAESPGPSATPPKKLSIDAVRIDAGDFLRGSPDSDRDAQDDEKPQNRISISHPFFLAKTKITQALFQKVMGRNPSAFGPDGGSKDKVRDVDTSEHPVESVRWIEAVEFCNKLSERDGLPPYYRTDGNAVTVNGGDGWRLPTEAEWEFACRAGTDARWSFGDDAAKLGDYAWFAGNSDGRTHPVGRKKPNPWGLYDMHGDVPEWCWDRYDAKSYQRDHVIDPTGAATGEQRVYRGGGWNDAAAQLRSASRQSLGVAYGGVLTHVGIRVARNASR